MLSKDNIKREIALFARENACKVHSQFYFDPETEAEAKKEISDAVNNPDSWILIDTDRFDGKIEMCFDCEPLDDQLRAYVTLGSARESVLHIEVIGE